MDEVIPRPPLEFKKK